MCSSTDHSGKHQLETKWSVTLKAGRKLRMFENWVLEEILGCEGNEVIV
jgi:hypothetical protein